MNIQDAINSGKPIRRPNNGWSYLDGCIWSNFAISLSKEDLISRDWEVLACKKHGTITQSCIMGSSIYCESCEAERHLKHVKLYVAERVHEGTGFDPKIVKQICDEFREALRVAVLDNLPKELTQITQKKIKCDCGAEKAGCGGHSNWCTKRKI